jgi:hypothetical protein
MREQDRFHGSCIACRSNIGFAEHVLPAGTALVSPDHVLRAGAMMKGLDTDDEKLF